MGIARRIQRQSGRQKVAITDTQCGFNKCRIFLANPNISVAGKAAKEFAAFYATITERAKRVNMGDLYEAHLRVLQKVRSGEDLVE